MSPNADSFTIAIFMKNYFTMAFVNKALDIKFKGKRFNCGSVEGYVKKTNYFAEREGLM